MSRQRLHVQSARGRIIIKKEVRLGGKIKKLIRGRGFGFIATEDGEDVFFHRSAVRGIRFDTLKEGDKVKFDLGSGSKGPEAVDVSLVRG